MACSVTITLLNSTLLGSFGLKLRENQVFASGTEHFRRKMSVVVTLHLSVMSFRDKSVDNAGNIPPERYVAGLERVEQEVFEKRKLFTSYHFAKFALPILILGCFVFASSRARHDSVDDGVRAAVDEVVSQFTKRQRLMDNTE